MLPDRRSLPRPTRTWFASVALLLCAVSAIASAVRPGTSTAATAVTGCAVPATAVPDPLRPSYRLDVVVDPVGQRASGTVEVDFVPDLTTDRLVFRLWPNRPAVGAAPNRLVVGDVTVDGATASSTLPDPTTLVVALGRTVPAGQHVQASVGWTLRLVGWRGDRISRTGSGDGTAIRLGSFAPVLAWEPGVGWDLTPPIRDRTEASMTPTADYRLSVRVPDGFDVLASGVPDGAGVWTATAVRDVAISVGHFRMATGVAHAPNPVAVTVGVQRGLPDDPTRYVQRIISALEAHGGRFGAYPWPSYSVAITPDLKGGIEYPMHVMQGPNSIGRSTPHEVAHMWFYGLVGNDQGRDPWLDEGLATWAETRSEGTLAAFQAKPVPSVGRNRVGAPMKFWDANVPAYYRSVYVQTTQMLATLGTAAQVDCALRIYVARNAYRVARPADLVVALEAVFPDAGAVLTRWGALGG